MKDQARRILEIARDHHRPTADTMATLEELQLRGYSSDPRYAHPLIGSTRDDGSFIVNWGDTLMTHLRQIASLSTVLETSAELARRSAFTSGFGSAAIRLSKLDGMIEWQSSGNVLSSVFADRVSDAVSRDNYVLSFRNARHDDLQFNCSADPIDTDETLLDIEPILSRCDSVADSRQTLAKLFNNDIEHGNPQVWQPRELRLGHEEMLIRLVAPVDAPESVCHHFLSPACLYGVLSSAVVVANPALSTCEEPVTLSSIESLSLYGAETVAVWVWVRRQSNGIARDVLRLSVCDERGRLLAVAEGLQFANKSLNAVSNGTATQEPDVELRRIASDYLRSVLERVSNVPASRLLLDTKVESYGIDSVMVLKLTEDLEKVFGELPKTLLFEYQTLAELTEYFARTHPKKLRSLSDSAHLASVSRRESLTSKSAIQAPPVPTTSKETDKYLNDESTAARLPIAVIGLAGQYPMADNVEQLWENIKEGRDCVTEVPASRWNHESYFSPDPEGPHETYSKWGGFLNGVDCFDPAHFRISPREAEIMDPQERLFLECCHNVLEDAGRTPDSLAQAGKTGVFVGVMYEEYQLYGSVASGRDAPAALPGSPASIANRVSYTYGFTGPSMALDTMCSSSLTALHLACRSIETGECKTAIAGGVNVSIHPNKYLLLSRGRFLSSHGRCKAFGEGGDGYVPGEGVGAVLLKPLAAAIADGDNIHAVIRGTALNHGGRTHGYTVPSLVAQAAVVGEALTESGVNPKSISYIEAHGTGTSLGDPIEIAGLRKAFADLGVVDGECAIGSIKSNIGHCESAAGIAGLSKVIMQLRHRLLAPSLHAEELNAHVDFGDGPFRLQRKVATWPDTRLNSEVGMPNSRVAGVSSFGAGGSNAHVVVEEYSRSRRSVQLPVTGALLVLSARTAPQLLSRARDLLSWLEQNSDSVDLSEVAYTLQVGREALRFRFAAIVTDFDELRLALSQFLEQREPANIKWAQSDVGSAVAEPALLGNNVIGANTEYPEIVGQQRFKELFTAWLRGADIQWNSHYAEGSEPTRISLPTYPFDRDRYWAPSTRPQSEHSSLSPSDKSTAEGGGNGDRLSESIWFTQSWETCSDINKAADSDTELDRVLLVCGFGNTSERLQEAADVAGFSRVLVLKPQGIGIEEQFADAVHQVVLSLQSLGAPCEAEPNRLLQLLVPGGDGQYGMLGALSALLNSVSMEQKRVNAQLIEIEHAEGRENVVIDAVVGLAVCDAHLRLGSTLERAEWREHLVASASLPQEVWRSNGVYLVTGGTGGLGLLMAQEIARNAAGATVVLCGRSVPGNKSDAAVQLLLDCGVRAFYQSVDISNAAALNSFVSSIVTEHGTLHGVIHCAGLTRDNVLGAKNRADIDAVLGPKVSGLVHLDRATRDLPLDLFVVFSSASGSFGNIGQADYAAANGFMDHYLMQRERLVRMGERQGRSLSIGWPLWRAGGMSMSEAAERTLWQTVGLSALESKEGLRQFYLAHGSDRAHLTLLHGDKRRLRDLVHGVAIDERVRVSTALSDKSTVINKVVGVDDNGRHNKLEQMLIGAVSTILKIEQSLVDPDVPLFDMGFDSVSLTELASAMEKNAGETGAKITPLSDPTVFFEHPTLALLSTYLIKHHSETVDLLLGADHQMWEEAEDIDRPTIVAAALPDKPDVAIANNAVNRDTEQAIAVVGMSVRFPGARNLDEFWQNLQDGRDCISEVPFDRWDWQAIYGDPKREAGKTNIKWGGFMEGIAEFDPLFFNIAPREAAQMDPQQRLLLMHSWAAIEDAGYAADDLSGTSTGVFFATSTSNGYTEVSLKADVDIESHTATGVVSSVGPNRVSYFLNLTGPSEPIETACSSSLVALHRAVASIRSGDCEMALVGGVNTMASEAGHIGFSKAGMLSETGRCRSFSSGADGYVRGEGVGVLLIKKLDQALDDGDLVYGLIRGSSLNHGGRANSLTAPNPSAQANLIEKAYDNAGVDARSVTYVEAHGTGTPLGDPIEIDGLKRAFSRLHNDAQKNTQSLDRAAPCAIGSVKSNIGHLELAAGVAGVAKVLLQLRQQTIVKGLYDQDINPRCDLHGSPFYYAAEKQPWPSLVDSDGCELPRRAGVSSFGFGGVNAHVVLEEHVDSLAPGTVGVDSRRYPRIFVLSAKTRERLSAYAKRWCDAIDSGRLSDRSHRLADVLYVAQTGRRQMEHRIGFTVNSLEEIRDGLKSLCDVNNIGVGEHHYGKMKRGRIAELGGFETTEERDAQLGRWFADGDNDKLLERWVLGMAVDWSRAYDKGLMHRLRLPTYPFATNRYWVSDSAEPDGSAPKQVTSVASASSTVPADKPLIELIPLAHPGDQSEQTFRLLLSGRERFVLDHVVQDRTVLPGVLILEVVCAAFRKLETTNAQHLLHLRNVTWVRPIVYENGRPNIGFVLASESENVWRFRLIDLDEPNAAAFSQGSAVLGESLKSRPVALSLETASRVAVAPDALYSLFASVGLAYGPAHRPIESMHVSEGEVVARLRLPDAADQEGLSFSLHPSLLDGALQASIGLFFPAGLGAAEQAKLALPFALDEIEIYNHCSTEVEVRAFPSRDNDANSSISKVDLEIYDANAQLCVRIKGFSSRLLPPAAVRATALLQKADVALEFPEVLASSDEPGGEQLVIAIGFDAEEVDREIRAATQQTARIVTLSPSAQAANTASVFKHYASLLADYLREMLLERERRQPLSEQCLVRVVCCAHQDFNLRGLAAFLRSVQRESVKLGTQYIEVESGGLSRALRYPWGSFLSRFPEMILANQSAKAPVWRPIAVDSNKQPLESSPWRCGGVYLITGGGGQLGLLTAMHIAKRTEQPVIVLTGRSKVTTALEQSLESLRDLGATVEYHNADISDSTQAQELVKQIRHCHGAIHGVLHSAGVLDDELLKRKSSARFLNTLTPKVEGLVALDMAIGRDRLDFIVTYSSIAGLFGNAGQTDYAAANAFMDDYMSGRMAAVARGDAYGMSVSICWPYWEAGGMQMGETGVMALKAAAGMYPLESDEAFKALDKVLAEGSGVYAVLRGEGERFHTTLDSLSCVPDGGAKPAKPTAKAQSSSSRQASNDDLAARVELLLTQRISTLLEVEADDIDVDAPLNEFGFDSITLTDFATSMSDDFSLDLSPTVLFEYSTIDALAGYLAAEYADLFEDKLDANMQDDPTPKVARVTQPHTSVSTQKATAPDVPAVELAEKTPVQERLTEVLAEALGVSVDQVETDTPMSDLVLEATTLATMAKVLDVEFSLKADLTSLFDGETWEEGLAKLVNSMRPIQASTGSVLAVSEREDACTADLPEVSALEPMERWTESSMAVGHHRLKISRWGRREKHVAVCLHGYLDQGPIWHPVANELVKHGWSVIAPDLRGHGLSDLASQEGNYDIAAHMADIRQVIEFQVGRPVVLIGHSMSALLAVYCLNEFPEQIEATILIESVIPPDLSQPSRMTELAKGVAGYRHQVFADVETAAKRLRLTVPALSKPLSHELASRITRPSDSGKGLVWTWDERLRTDAFGLVNGVTREGYLDAIAKLKRAPLIINSLDSGFISDVDMAQLEAVIGSQSMVQLGGGHHLHIDQATAVAARIVDFVDSQGDVVLGN